MRNKMRGFTLIELMIVLAFSIISLAIIVFCIVSFASSKKNHDNISIGVNGIVATRCVGGYQFVVDNNGTVRQIMDEFGHGVRCQ